MTASAPAAPSVAAPRFEHAPEAARSSAPEVFDLLDLLGLPLLDWQRRTLELQLGENADGSWAAPWVVEIVPRQNGKSHKWAARILAGLFVLGEGMITYTAHKVDTALEVFNLVDRYARAHPETRRLVARTIRAQGKEGIELVTGQRLRVMARTRSGGRGFSGDCLILDEALELRDQAAINSLLPTLSARENPQLILASSAGDPGSVVLRDQRERGRNHEPGMCYVEYSAPEDADPDDEDAWAAANPALGQLISLDAIRRERRIMSEDGFRQERLGIWAADMATAVIPAHCWAETAYEDTLEPQPGEVGLAFDVAVDRSWSSIVAAYRSDQGKLHTRILQHDEGDGWLVDRLVALAGRFNVAVSYDDAGPARDVADALRVAQIPVCGLSGRDYAAACARLLSGIVNASVTHHPDLALDEAAHMATTRRIGEGWAFARRKTPNNRPISPITAAAIAVWAHEHRDPEPAPPPRPGVF